MRAIDVVRILGPCIGLIAAVVLFRRKKLFRELRAAGATTPQAAQPIDGTGLTGFWRRKLLAAGVLRPTSGDRYWLDLETWRAYQGRRKRRALTIVAIVGMLALATIAYVAWRGRPAKAASAPLVSSASPAATNAAEVLQLARAILADTRLVEALEVPQLGTGQFRVGRVLRVTSELFPGGYLVAELTDDAGVPLARLAMTPSGGSIMAEPQGRASGASLDLPVVADKVRARLARAPLSSEYVYFHNPMERGVSLCRPLVEARTGDGTLYFTSQSEVFADQSSPVARRIAPGAPVRYEMTNGLRLVPLGRW